MSDVNTAAIRRSAQYEVTAAERRGRHLPPVISRDVPALCDEVDRLATLAECCAGFAGQNAISARARGDLEEERRWLDLAIIIERGQAVAP